MKQKVKNGSGSVKIDPKVFEEAKKICDSLGKKISFYVTEAVKKQNAQFK